MSLFKYMRDSILFEEKLTEAKRLLSSFTFGFELEAATNDPEYGSGSGLPGYSGYTKGSARGDAKKVKDKLDELLDINDMQSYIENIESMNNNAQMVELVSADNGEKLWFKNGKVYSNDEPLKNFMLGFVEENVYHYRNPNEKVGKFPHKGTYKESGVFYDDKGKMIAKVADFDEASYNDEADDIKDISTIEKDGSLTNPSKGGWTFEYGSPKIKATYENMKKYLKFLKSLKKNGFYTYEKCGFHHHFSFDGLDKEMLSWILFCSANDEETYKMLTGLETKDETIGFTHPTYASTNTLDMVKIRNGEIPTIRVSDDKMNVFHIHSRNGTIEWRGPRNFLNYERDDYIVQFISQMWKVMLKWANFADMNEFKGFKKEDVIQKITYVDKWESPEDKKMGKKKDSWIAMIKKDPTKLLTFSPDKLKIVLDDWDISQISNEDEVKKIVSVWQKIPSRTKELILDKIANSYTNTLFKAMDQWLEENTGKKFKLSIEDTKMLINIIKRSTSRSDSNRDGMFNLFVPFMVIDDPKIVDDAIQAFGFTKPIIKLLKRTSLDKLSIKTIKDIINSKNVYIMRYQDNIPPQIQRMMIRKNPYNIQYISNPEKSIVDDLKKKYGEDISSYMIGV